MCLPPRRPSRARISIAPKRMQLVTTAANASPGAALGQGLVDESHALSVANAPPFTTTTTTSAGPDLVTQMAFPISCGPGDVFGSPLSITPPFVSPFDICPPLNAYMDDSFFCPPVWNPVNWAQDGSGLDFNTPSPTTVPAQYAYPSPTTICQSSPAQPWPPTSAAPVSTTAGSRRSQRRSTRNTGRNGQQQHQGRDHVLASILYQCLASSPTQSRRLSEIYRWVERHYGRIREPGYSSDWKNTVRHNLSQNKSFEKAPGPGPAKSSPWRLSAEAARTGIVPSTAGCRNPNPVRREKKSAARRNVSQQQREHTAGHQAPPPQQQLPQQDALMDVDDHAFAAMEAQYGGWVDPSLTADWVSSGAPMLDGDWGAAPAGTAPWSSSALAPDAEGMWNAAPNVGQEWTFDGGAAMDAGAGGEEAMFLNAMQGGLEEWL